jgi:predicted Zn finger-like uncharacterized protein
MIRVVCPNCQTKYRFDESLLKGKSSGQARCKKCGDMIEVSLDATAPSPIPDPAVLNNDDATQDTTARVSKLRSDEDVGDNTATMSGRIVEKIELPQDKKYSLAVLQGKASGQIFPITKCQITIGRSDTDILLDDPECSRQHAVIDIHGARITLTDSGSTNGTFVEGKRIDQTELDKHSEFRIGEHVMMLIITDRE